MMSAELLENPLVMKVELEEVLRLLREQTKPGDELLEVRGLLVSRDVWRKLSAVVPPSQVATMSACSWTVNVSPWAPENTIIPVDAKGMPILKRRVDADWQVAELDDPDPWCDCCGHVQSDHARAGHCGASIEDDDGNADCCSCPRFARTTHPRNGEK